VVRTHEPGDLPLSRHAAAGRRLLATARLCRTAARWRGWGVAPGARGVSAPRRAHHAGRPQQQREGGQGVWAGSMVRGGGTRPMEKAV